MAFNISTSNQLWQAILNELGSEPGLYIADASRTTYSAGKRTVRKHVRNEIVPSLAIAE